jgi:hypothetical protein
MANRKKSYRRKGFQLPIAIVSGLVPGVIKVWEAGREGISAAAREAGEIYTGFDFWNKQFTFGKMLYGIGPIVLGGLVHKYVGGKMGINNALSRAGVPFIRL